ncbi:unnamed protein product, partial [Effrenium voratum]
ALLLVGLPPGPVRRAAALGPAAALRPRLAAGGAGCDASGGAGACGAEPRLGAGGQLQPAAGPGRAGAAAQRGVAAQAAVQWLDHTGMSKLCLWLALRHRHERGGGGAGHLLLRALRQPQPPSGAAPVQRLGLFAGLRRAG